ncbi:hypothetical protein NMY22_g8361 [Coprinellus aureogranulatus]|nr:hypothetical protein NMY22_g8361 [Coprinellus aureogranulatus]
MWRRFTEGGSDWRGSPSSKVSETVLTCSGVGFDWTLLFWKIRRGRRHRFEGSGEGLFEMDKHWILACADSLLSPQPCTSSIASNAFSSTFLAHTYARTIILKEKKAFDTPFNFIEALNEGAGAGSLTQVRRILFAEPSWNQPGPSKEGSRRHFYYRRGISEIRKAVADLSAGIQGEAFTLNASRTRALKGLEGDLCVARGSYINSVSKAHVWVPHPRVERYPSEDYLRFSLSNALFHPSLYPQWGSLEAVVGGRRNISVEREDSSVLIHALPTSGMHQGWRGALILSLRRRLSDMLVLAGLCASRIKEWEGLGTAGFGLTGVSVTDGDLKAEGALVSDEGFMNKLPLFPFPDSGLWDWNLNTGPSRFSSPSFASTPTPLRSFPLPRPRAGRCHVVERVHLFIGRTPKMGFVTHIPFTGGTVLPLLLPPVSDQRDSRQAPPAPDPPDASSATVLGGRWHPRNESVDHGASPELFGASGTPSLLASQPTASSERRIYA